MFPTRTSRTCKDTLRTFSRHGYGNCYLKRHIQQSDRGTKSSRFPPAPSSHAGRSACLIGDERKVGRTTAGRNSFTKRCGLHQVASALQR